MGLRIKLVLLAAVMAASVVFGQSGGPWNCGAATNVGGIK